VNLYFNNLLVEFDKPEELTLRIMKSDGGFGKSSSVRASQLLLSGPAGGLIGCKSIINLFEDILTTQVNSNF
jgi:N-methylhydantoinase A/oxoprolinase/acetone carboxylase beta subunit